MTNAFRYNPEGKVVLGARRVNGHELMCGINGTGIDEDKQQEIFGRVTRGSQVRADQGLGLVGDFECRIAHVLGHQISMRSRPGEGKASFPSP
ncbi:hypothetical protein O9992_07980 [Vibrio lentus]|nr:hypothetical protein [Vibrio lentus]